MADAHEPTSAEGIFRNVGIYPFNNPNEAWLAKLYSSEEEMAKWIPRLRGELHTWEIPILRILAEDYHCLDAIVLSYKYDPDWHTHSIVFGGYCPIHKRHHQNQHWKLVNRDDQDVTQAFCYHGKVKKWIWAKMPFP